MIQKLDLVPNKSRNLFLNFNEPLVDPSKKEKLRH